MINIWVAHKHLNFNSFPNFIPELFNGIIGKDNDRESWEKALGVKKKEIFKDTVNHTEDNIALIRTPCINSYGLMKESREYEWEEHIFPLVEWCLDNHIKVALDDGWETGAHSYRARGELLQRKEISDFIFNNNIKIITNIPPSLHNQFKFDNAKDTYFSWDSEFSKVYINADFFLYQTRQIHQRENYVFKLNTYPTTHKDKKYLFSCLFGDITKRNNGLLYGQLLKNNLIDEKVFISTIIEGGKQPQSLNAQDFGLVDVKDGVWYEANVLARDVCNWINEDEERKKQIYHHSPFERNYPNLFDEKIVARVERRIPQELYDSHFAINVESTMHPWFFTEKTFKNIIAKVPHLGYAGHYHSAGLKQHFGFEKFEEIFDYTAEETPPRNSYPFLILKGVKENIERLRKEPLSIFDQPSVKDKLNHNESLFYKLTTTDRLRTHLEKVINEILHA